jgi:YbbR domain-containing protein
MAWHPFRNLGLKVAALALGTALWFTVSGEQVERKVPGVQVHYRNIPAGLQITEQVDVVDVQVRGVESQITALQPGELVVDVDLRAEGEGTHRLRLRTDQVRAPLGVEISQIDPGTVMVTLEPTGSAEVPIDPRIEGEPAQGFVISEMTTEPARATIVGPARRLTTTTRAVTDRVSVAGATKPVSAVVSVGIEDAQLRVRQPVTARVTVQIEPAGTRTVLSRVILRNVPPGRKVRLDPETVFVTLRGADRVLAAIDPASVVAYVDLAGLRPGVYTPPVQVRLDGRYALGPIQPATVTVRIQ